MVLYYNQAALAGAGRMYRKHKSSYWSKARFQKGSAAAKAYMARLRAMRRRR